MCWLLAVLVFVAGIGAGMLIVAQLARRSARQWERLMGYFTDPDVLNADGSITEGKVQEVRLR